MKNIRYIIIFILIIFLLFSFSGCKDQNTPPETDPQTENELTAEESQNYFFSSKMPYDRSFQVETNPGKFVYYINEGDFIIYDLKPEGNGEHERYLGKIDGQYYLIESFNDYFDENKNASEYVRLNEIEAKILLNKEFKEFDVFSNFKSNTIPIVESSKSYDSSFGNITYSGKQYQTDGQVYSTEIKLNSLVAMLSNVFVFTLQASFNELNLPIDISSDFSRYQPYFPTSLNYDSYMNLNEGFWSYSFSYSDINLTMPNISEKTDATPEIIDLTPIDGNFPDTFNNSSLQLGLPVTLPEPIETDARFLGWYYDEEYKYPVNGQFIAGAMSEYVYAKWDTKPVTLELNGGKLAEDVFDYPTFKEYLNYIPYKIGYYFDGWYKDSSFETELSSEDISYITEPTTLYAKWIPLVKINLSIDTDYKVLPLLGIPGQTIVYPDNDNIVKKGGLFSGWYKDTEYSELAPVAFSENDITVYAKFDQAICITIGDVGQSYPYKYYNILPAQSDFAELYMILSEALNNQAQVLEEGLMVFSGWYTDSELTQEFNTYPKKDVTLYAKFSWAKYIRFDLMGGTYQDDIVFTGEYLIQYKKNDDFNGYQEFLENEAYNIIPPDGKEFDKWYLDSERTQAYEGTFWPDDDITLYAGYKSI